MLVDGADRGFDRLPVHLRLVELGAAGPEEDRVGEGRVVVDVGEAGEGDREGFADARPQGADVEVGGGVLAFVVALGVDHQAVGALLHRGGADAGLGDGRVAVDELPGADVEPATVQRLHQAGRELAPGAAAVAGLDVDGADAEALGAGDDRRDAAALGVVDVPDPHALTVEGRVAQRRRFFQPTGSARFSGRGGWGFGDRRH